MATDKKGFILYADLIHTVNQLPNDKAGELFKHILSYVNDESPVSKDIIINVTFEPIKQQLKRDLKKYDTKKTQWSEAGKASAEARKKKKNEINDRSTDSTTVKNRSTDSTVTVNVNDTVNDTVKENDINYKIYYFAADYLENKELVKAIKVNFKISDDEFKKWFNKFKVNYIEPQNELEFSNAKKHFLNWLKKQPITIQETLEEKIERKRKDADKFG